MVKKCCVPNCRGNYDDKTAIPVFRFPKDEERKKLWLTKIKREDFQPKADSVVCAVHFAERFATTSQETDSAKKRKPSLTSDAFPSFFLEMLEPKSSQVIYLPFTP